MNLSWHEGELSAAELENSLMEIPDRGSCILHLRAENEDALKTKFQELASKHENITFLSFVCSHREYQNEVSLWKNGMIIGGSQGYPVEGFIDWLVQKAQDKDPRWNQGGTANTILMRKRAMLRQQMYHR